jgi:hypothetical protein
MKYNIVVVSDGIFTIYCHIGGHIRNLKLPNIQPQSFGVFPVQFLNLIVAYDLSILDSTVFPKQRKKETTQIPILTTLNKTAIRHLG